LTGRNIQEILNTWKAHSSMLGKEVRVIQGNQTISGIALDLTDDGGLLLQTNGTTTKILSGDVHLLH